jgi:hypothetical protein
MATFSYDEAVEPVKSTFTYEDAAGELPKADPKIGQPEELTFAEKHVAPLLEALGFTASTKGGKIGGILRGAADPSVAAVQMVANALPGDAGKNVNAWHDDMEREYQAARVIEGRDGFDAMRAVGSAVATAPLGAAGAGVVRGAAVGAGSGLLDPVRDAKEGMDFWAEKGKQAAIGATAGAVISPLAGALARVASPKASTDAAVKMLRDEGVDMSMGQAAGGVLNAMEQRATSLPVVGDAIAAARRRGIDSFNTAAINRATEPIGVRVQGSGHEAVKEAGDALSTAYDAAARNVGHVNLVGTRFDANFGQLQQMASQGLMPDLSKRFDSVLQNVVLRRMSPSGSVAGSEIKKIDSELGKIAAEWRKSGAASEREFGDAVRQLQQNFRDGLADADPVYAAAQAAADKGWASLKRVRGAAGAAKNEEGIFTPAQLNAQAARYGGATATAEGRATMQDLARAGQRLGTKVPDSGTAGRVAFGAGALAGGAVEPSILASIMAGTALYQKPIQNAIVRLMADRPKSAPRVANSIRRLAPPATIATIPFLQEQR